MDLADLIDLAHRARECAERAQREAAFWQRMIEQRMRADTGEPRHEGMQEFC